MITSEPEGDDQVAMITGTRSGILETLKRAGSLTAADLAREMGVSAIAARQHLSVLEAEGLVEASLRRKSGVGRPSSVYHLTEKGQETFPRLYDEFLLLVLKGVREIGGVSGMKALLDWRTEETDRHYGPQLRWLPPRERVNALFDILAQTGHMPELREAPGEVIIEEYNCPIARISREFPEICQSELALMERLVDLPTTRDTCMAHGSDVCRYRFSLPSA
jgi:predicted ArsR family transcriptional regulator